MGKIIKIMTNKEKELLDIAKEMMSINECEIALTGSLMLAYRGINKRREAKDIDLLISPDADIEEIKLPFSFDKEDEEVNKDGYVVAFRAYNKDEIKIEVMISDEMFHDINGVPCGSIKELINAKRTYSTSDTNYNSKMKHTLDLEYLCHNNDEKVLS
ncbi:hypothetical protein ACFX5L_09180 [Bacteroides sp. KG123]|uniref:hypothetical protein n=1 Tax=unclassified Bacteroides TaxID=2646097 RepID=UPI003D7F19D7